MYINTAGLVTNCLIVGNVATSPAGTHAFGGGVYCISGVLTNCVISLNVATPYSTNQSGYGGGVYCSSAAGVVNNCIVSTNTATHTGGGIFGGTVLNSVIVSNQANIVHDNNQGGGGCYGCAIVSNCTLSWNSGGSINYGYGGGAYGCTMVADCTNISYNVARRGGGVAVGTGGQLQGSQIFRNWASAGAGVLMLYGGAVSGCTIHANATIVEGGGIYCYSGAAGSGPSVLDSIISNNISSNTSGGGIHFTNYTGITGTVQRCTIVMNQVLNYGHGGGIYADVEPIVIQDCTLRGNLATGYGGGIYTVNNTGVVERCVFANNQSEYSGGGGYFFCGVQVRNCLFTGNVATNGGFAGGGVYLDRIGNSNGYLSACTIVSNRASYGGGLGLTGTNNYAGNCIVVSNMAVAGSNDLYFATGEQQSSFWYCCSSVPLPQPGNITAPPQFVDFAGGNYRLASGSPCINAGTNQLWMEGAVDLDGHVRIRYNRVDIGAYEFIRSGAIMRIR